MGIGSIAGALFHVVGPELASLAVDAIRSRKSKNTGGDGDAEAAPATEVLGEEQATLALLVRQLDEIRVAELARSERLAVVERDLAAARVALGQIECRQRRTLALAAASVVAAVGALAAAMLT